MLIAYNHATIPCHDTSLDVRHSMDEAAYFLLNLLGGNFPVVNSGRFYRVLLRLDLACLVLDLLLQESLSGGRDPQC